MKYTFKNIFYISLVSLIVASCKSKLPEQFYKKTLKEENYVENNKNNYVLHFDKKSVISGIWMKNTHDSDQKNLQIGPQDSVVIKKLKYRPYFYLLSGYDTTIVSARNIDFKKTVNFRDIGGLETKDGRTVKWGKIYRSDNLSKLKSSELKKFNDLNIKTVFDLRTTSEIKGKEDHLPENTNYVHTPTIEDNADMLSKMRKKVIRGEISEEQSLQLMFELYQGTVSDNIPLLRNLIHQILDSDKPVLYHCSAGKDRTGIITALILSIFNVDKETIMKEYLMSNYYRKAKIEKMIGIAKIVKVIKPHIRLKVIENFMDVDARYLNAAFDKVDSNYGGIEQFIKKELGIDDQERKHIIEKFTY